DESLSAWDAAVLERQTTPHFMQSLAWGTFKEPGAWSVARRHIGESGFPVQSFEREAEGYGLLQHLPRVSGLAAADVA
ncbi:hypothetical protein ACC691_41545, partial [Rhizobium johnstonii]|uniref:hypothetical protein n=1 Tax=Rhizobium johnstonii TaxID=3019933 RepID=UPI003F98416E